MNTLTKFLFLSCAFFGFSGVALGAFGAHALKARLGPDAMAIYQTAVQYQFWHALGIGLIALTLLHMPASATLKWAGVLMAIGVVLFSGSLYALAISGIRSWGMITPLGGATWLVAWTLFGWALWRS